MLNEKAVIEAFADYFHQNLSPEKRQAIDEFLKTSEATRQYYRQMERVMTEKGELPSLQANPNLARMIAQQAGSKKRDGATGFHWLRPQLGAWVFTFILAIYGGIQMGQSLAQDSTEGNSDLASAYYEALVLTDDPANSWSDLLETDSEE